MGVTLKDGIAGDIVNLLKGGAQTTLAVGKAVHALATTDYDDCLSVPQLAKDSDPNQQYSPIFDYLKPRFNHLARQAFSSLLWNVASSAESGIGKITQAGFNHSER